MTVSRLATVVMTMPVVNMSTVVSVVMAVPVVVTVTMSVVVTVVMSVVVSMCVVMRVTVASTRGANGWGVSVIKENNAHIANVTPRLTMHVGSFSGLNINSHAVGMNS